MPKKGQKKEVVRFYSEGLTKSATKIAKAYPGILGHICEYGVAVVSVVGKAPTRAGRMIYAHIMAVREPYKIFMEFPNDQEPHFIIEVFDDNINSRGLEKSQIDKFVKLVLFHELLHIDQNGKLQPHDIEDFSTMQKIFGNSWMSNFDKVPDPETPTK